MKYSIFIGVLMIIFGCNIIIDNQAQNKPNDSDIYFPPINSNKWQTISPKELGWNQNALENLLTYLEENNTRAFIILKDGKIVIEEYFSKSLIGLPFKQCTKWYWASAGKTLTATLIGIAQHDGILDIEKPTSTYLGEGWTSLTPEKESLIKIKHQLSMTTGLDYKVSNQGCTEPTCLTYKTDAGQQWYYHNALYTLLSKVIENSADTDYNTFTVKKLTSKIGMKGKWRPLGDNLVYWSTARDMARFGLFILNKGQWQNSPRLIDMDYYNQMTNSSQDINLSYGYLWWLNGKSLVILPTYENSIDKPLSVNAPKDLIAGLGKNGQFVEVIPSKNMVVIRMGKAPDNAQVPILFHDEMWKRINQVIE